MSLCCEYSRVAGGSRVVARSGHTLLEAVVVIAILALIVSIVGVNYFGAIRGNLIDEDVGLFCRTLRLTAEEAVLRGRELIVVVEVTDGYYTVYESNKEDDYDDEETEPVIDRKSLDVCYLDIIEFDDGTQQFSGELYLRATPEGWKHSILMTLLDDRDEQYRYIRIDRLTTRVLRDRNPLEMLEPQEEVSI